MIVLLFTFAGAVIALAIKVVAALFYMVLMFLAPKPVARDQDEGISPQALAVLKHLGMTPETAPPAILAQIMAQAPAGGPALPVRSGRKP